MVKDLVNLDSHTTCNLLFHLAGMCGSMQTCIASGTPWCTHETTVPKYSRHRVHIQQVSDLSHVFAVKCSSFFPADAVQATHHHVLATTCTHHLVRSKI